jgi:hypothetical protein
MGWSLGYTKPHEPELLDAAFLSAGRALHLAGAFESKCRYILRTINLVRAMQANPMKDLMDAIAAAPADKLLGPTLRDLTNTLPTLPADVLDKARLARNFIAHEGADVGSVWARSDDILRHVVKLRGAVADLTAGDNVVSEWVYGLEEPHQSVPRDLIKAYPAMIDNWVFSHFGGLLDEPQTPDAGSPSSSPSAGEGIGPQHGPQRKRSPT